MKVNDILDQIENYVEGKMSEPEQIEFENQLKSDNQLAASYEAYKNAVSAIRSMGRENLKSKLNIIHNEVMVKKDTRKHNYRKLLRVAAVFAATTIITSAVFIWIAKSNADKDDLFSEYFKPYMNVTSTRGDIMEKNTFLQKTAMYYYSNRQYDRALLNFEELYKNTKEVEPEVLLYYGISALAEKKNTKAIEIFTRLSNDKTGVFYEQSLWYLALTYLQIKDLPKTRSTLRTIIKLKGSYTDKALDLLEKVD